MAEETDEKELDLEAEEGEESAEAQPKSKKMLFIGAGVALVAAIGAGAFFFLGGEPEVSDELAEEEVEVPLEEAHYLELEPPFIINLPDRGRQRFLQATITVMAHSREAILTMEKHMPAIRHNMSVVLSSQTIPGIQSEGGIELVRTEAKEQLNRILLDEYGSEAIEEVLFTAFVMQ